MTSMRWKCSLFELWNVFSFIIRKLNITTDKQSTNFLRFKLALPEKKPAKIHWNYVCPSYWTLCNLSSFNLESEVKMEEKLLSLGKRNDLEKLKNFVQSVDINKFCAELNQICLKDDGCVVLQTFFKGLTSLSKCQEKKAKVSMEVLNIIQKNYISPKISSKLMSVIGAEVEHLSTAHLIKLTNSCMQLLQNGNEGDSTNCWKDLLPILLNIIIEIDSVEHDGTLMSGKEYKSEIVTALCVNEFQNHMVTNVACMFIDFPLSPEEHLKVVNKLCKSIGKLKLGEIPPLVYQILQLTKERNSMPLFTSLAEFFDLNLYSYINSNSDMPVSQVIPEDGFPLKELQIIEGTILYHVTNGLMSGAQNVKDFLKILSNCYHQPQFVLRPFFVTLLLSISSISCTFEQEVLNIFKSTILRCISENEKVAESAWIDSVVPVKFDVEDVLYRVTQNCYRDRDRILKGLISLAFSLLETVKTRGKDFQYECIWNLGTTLLVNLVQKYPQVTNSVFHNLVNQISQIHESTQFTDCLTKIARKKPLSLIDSSGTIMQLLGNICVRLPGIIGQRVIAAILPLTKMSPSLRDNLIIFLRKSLFGEKSSKEMAVYGFLELLKDLKITDVRSLSQSISQNYVGITQIYSGTYSTGGAINNEGLCLEILSILSQVFEYNYEVKIVLYKGVYDCFYGNPKLGAQILDNLKSQLDKYYKINDSPPLDFQKCVLCQGSSVVVQEPIASLLFSLALISAKVEDDFNGQNKFNEILDSISERMAESDIPHFGFEKEFTQNFVEDLPENQLKQERIRQILGVYEALMGHVLCTWKKDSLEHGRKLNSLFKGFSRLSDYAKNLGKLDKKKLDDNKKASQKEDLKSKDKTKCLFKLPPTVLNLKCASRLLSLLNGAKPNWASDESVELVKGKRDLHRYAFNVTLELISQIRLMSASELSRSKYMLQYVSVIGRVLYLRCVSRLSDVKRFDGQCAYLALECFSELITLVCFNFKSKLSVFFTEIGIGVGNNDLKDKIKSVIDEVLNQLKDILNDDAEDTEPKEETHTKKISLLLVSVASFLSGQLSRGGLQLAQVLNKIKGICKESKIENPNLAKALLSLLLSVYIKYKPSGGLMLDLVLCLCDSMPLIDDEMEIDTHEKYAIINGKTANNCLFSICEAVHFMVSEVEWMVSRFKAELSILSFPTEEPLETKQETLEEREREMCRHMNFCIKILSTICTIAVPPGTLSDSVMKEVGNVYNKLVLVTKYFILKVTKHHQPFQSTRFEKTIKLADHELAKNMYCFTEHIIADGAASTDDPPLKKQKKDAAALRNKVIKETKIIPRVIYEKEQFQKFALQLSLKAKVDLEMKHTMARDYRLYTKQLKEVIEKENMYLEENSMVDEESQSESTQASKRARTQE